MEEEVTQKTIALVIRAARLDGNVLRSAMRAYLNHHRQHAQNHVSHGRKTVRDLIGEGQGVASIEVTDGNIRSFEHIARKYNIDYAMHYNPFAYIRGEKDILKLVNTIIVNTKGEGQQSGEDFWVSATCLQTVESLHTG